MRLQGDVASKGRERSGGATRLAAATAVSTLALVSAASAADLPSAKAAPVDYVRVCDAFGAGFFYIPGTDTCLRFSGSARAEATVRGDASTGNLYSFGRNLSGQVYSRDYSALRITTYLNADARTQTAYGAVRTFVSYRMRTEPTPPGPSGGGNFTPAGSPFSQKTSQFQGINGRSYSILDKGFIQFAGITAGRAQSFFDFDAQSREFLTSSMVNSNQATELFAYTATFGKGITGTLSLEDRNERVIGDNGFLQANLNPTATKAGYLAYSGETVPDIVGALRVDQDWGSAQLAGAYHRVSSLAVVLPSGATVTPKDADGFAGIAGVKVLVPQIAKGDNFTLQGTYEAGGMSYINSLNNYVGISNIYSHDLSVSLPVNDGFVLPGGKIGLNHGYGGYAAFQHYWSPDWNSTLYGDYAEIENPVAAQLLSAGNDNARIYQVGGNIVWTPVKDFILGGEVLYTNMKLSGAAPLATAGTNAVGAKVPLPATSDDVRARLSIRRAF